MRINHMQSLENWANFVKNNPTKWKKIHTKFINAQFDKSYTFLKRLLQQPNGNEKIIKLFKIGNLAGYSKFLNLTKVPAKITPKQVILNQKLNK